MQVWLYKVAYNSLMCCDQQFENHRLKRIIRVTEGSNLMDEFRAKGLFISSIYLFFNRKHLALQVYVEFGIL